MFRIKTSRQLESPTNRAFMRTTIKIQSGLFRLMTGRRVDIKVSEVCKEAKTSPPTFYSHFSGINEILISYERRMKEDIQVLLLRATSREEFFVILAEHIVKHRPYFVMTERNGNHYWMMEILELGRARLAPRGTNDRSYTAYAGAIMMLIYHMLRHKHLKRATTEDCAKLLTSVRVMHIA